MRYIMDTQSLYMNEFDASVFLRASFQQRSQINECIVKYEPKLNSTLYIINFNDYCLMKSIKMDLFVY